MCDFTDIDECKQSPCKNGGTCTNKPGGYSCVCAAGFEGENCDGGLENTHVTSMAGTSIFILYCCYILCLSVIAAILPSRQLQMWTSARAAPVSTGELVWTSTEAIDARVRLVSTETTAKTVRGRLIDISDIVLCSDEGQLLLVEFGDSQEY